LLNAISGAQKMHNLSKFFVFFALLCCLLAGCGTKGPLYIPEQQYPQNNA
jgi:predicted small lipoprotein YifL